MRTLIRNGTVVNAGGAVRADVLVDGETISAVTAPGVFDTADRIIEADGRYVLPGGIDAHTHMEMPFGGTFSADTFATGTTAAAWGGTTTIIDFAVQAKGTSLLATLDKWHEKADAHCAIDYGFHMIVSDVNDQSLKEMESCIDAGVNSFKMFMAYPGVFYATDGEILRAMQKAAETGVDDHDARGERHRDRRAGRAGDRRAGGRTRVEHGITRPPELEAEATLRAIALAKVTGAPLYIVHLSARHALEAVAQARDDRAERVRRDLPAVPLPVHRGPGQAGLRGRRSTWRRRRCGPSEHQADLWRGLRTNDLSVVSTDHCPFCFKDQKELGRGRLLEDPERDAGRGAPDGPAAPGRRVRRLSLARWVEVACATPARMFGLYPRKGVIAPGADADIVVYDPAARQMLSVETHHMNVDYSAYEGMSITGRVRDRAVPRLGGDRRRRVPRQRGARQVPAPRAVAVPRLVRSVQDGLRCRAADGPAGERGRPADEIAPKGWVSATAGRSTRACCGRSRSSSTRRSWRRRGRLVVGPMVTNPATRDWSVTASLFATLNDMFGNRTVCGIGRGDSARRVIGQKPASLAVLRDSMHVIRELAEGREVDSCTGRRCGSRGCATGGWRCGWPPTARRRSGWSASTRTGSSCRRPTRRSPGGRSRSVRAAARDGRA